MREHRIPTSLTRFQSASIWDRDERRAKYKRLWHETGTFMIEPDMVPELYCKTIEDLGTLMYGKRGQA